MVPFPEKDPPHRSLVLPALLLTVITLVLAAAIAAGPWVLVGAACGLFTAAVTR